MGESICLHGDVTPPPPPPAPPSAPSGRRNPNNGSALSIKSNPDGFHHPLSAAALLGFSSFFIFHPFFFFSVPHQAEDGRRMRLCGTEAGSCRDHRCCGFLGLPASAARGGIRRPGNNPSVHHFYLGFIFLTACTGFGRMGRFEPCFDHVGSCCSVWPTDKSAPFIVGRGVSPKKNKNNAVVMRFQGVTLMCLFLFAWPYSIFLL